MGRACPFARVVALVCALTGGCTVGPDYVRPEVETPPDWHILAGEAAALSNARWWTAFGDAELDRLIDEALARNLDLVAAAARVDAFIGQLATTRAAFYPQASYSVDASRNRSTAVGVTPLPAGVDPYYSLYQAALGAQWQLDLFGRVRRQSEAAQARVYASEQGRRGVVVSVVTGVAASYIALRALDLQLEIAERTARNYADTLVLFDKRYKGGVVSRIEVQQVRSQYEQAQAAIPALRQQIAAQEHLLSVLTGRVPGAIARGVHASELRAPAIPADLPSSLLERRPDVLQAEQNLVAANASIGAAKALYYPQINLTATLGSVSAAFGDFLTSSSSAWTLAAGLAGPLFTGGAIAGQVATAEAQTREALASFQLTVLNAFRETNDALVGTQRKREEAEAQRRRVVALRDYAALSRRRFDNGYASYIEVLYAENELFGAELAVVSAEAERYGQLIALYKALGGGWVDEAGRDTVGSAPPAGERAARQPMF